MFTGSMQLFSDSENQKWNLGTWVLLMLVLLAGSYISFFFRSFTDSLLLYLPIALAFVMVHWFGLRILPLVFINAVITLFLWNASGGVGRILLLATHEPVIVFVSWVLCKNLIVRSGGLSNRQVFVKFVALGIFIPVLINSLYTYHYSFIDGDLEKVALLWLSDFITIFIISVPLLHFLRPEKTRLSFRLVINNPLPYQELSQRGLLEIILATLLFFTLGFFVSFDKYWFIYGVGATLIAVRHGFGNVILINAIIFILNYLIPLINFGSWEYGTHSSTQLVSVHLGMTTMFFGSAIIGRVICDLRNTQKELIVQKKQIENSNIQLSKANHEMDRFVYSVSHDISAPLKSIRGLIAISKLESKSDLEFPYLARIEESVEKLEAFTEEILDHSKASRKDIEIEDVNLHLLLDSILDNLKYVKGYNAIRFNIQLDYPLVRLDRFLLKVMLSNLISNAIKFQRNEPGVDPEIKIRSIVTDQLYIEVADNGEGIHNDYKNRIFEMFYRATTSSTGSGLGLFIAMESAVKLKGTISFQTTYGEGSIFTIELPLH